MTLFQDQMGNEVDLPGPPNKIISLVPSQTELFCDLGLTEKLVGITKFCVHPEEVYRSKTRIGGTKTLHLDKIRELNPDLIIANKEENEKSQIEELAREFPVWVSDVHDLDDALAMISGLGVITDKEEEADTLIKGVQEAFDDLATVLEAKGKSAVYLIWNSPIMCAGSHTFIDSMLRRCGLMNVFGKKRQRYPELTRGELRQHAPELVLLSSEPFPFKEMHLKAYQELLPESEVKLVDGELFSWYGSRLLKAPAYFKKVIKELKIKN